MCEANLPFSFIFITTLVEITENLMIESYSTNSGKNVDKAAPSSRLMALCGSIRLSQGRKEKVRGRPLVSHVRVPVGP